MARRHYNNTAQPTSLTSPVSSESSGHVETIDVVSTSGWPTVPFSAAIDRGTADEEAILVTAVTATTMTVSRGFDGTSSPAHLAGASVEHCLVTADLDDANAHVWDDTRDDHSQYLNLDRASDYFPQVLDGTGAVAIATITTTYQNCNTVTIPTETYDRKVKIFGTVSIQASAGAFYRARISRSGGAFGAAYFLSAGAAYATLQLQSDWLSVPAGAPLTYTTQIKRDSGSGGTADDDVNFNKISFLAVPDI